MSDRAKKIVGHSVPDRWMAEIFYVSGPPKVIAFEEIEDLDEIIEHGPDWNEIDRIVLTLNRSSRSPVQSLYDLGQP